MGDWYCDKCGYVNPEPDLVSKDKKVVVRGGKKCPKCGGKLHFTMS